MHQFSIFQQDFEPPKIFAVGDTCECLLPCPQRMIPGVHDEYGYWDGCYNYMAKIEVVAVLPDNRAICKNIDGHLANHTGWTIVPFDFLEPWDPE